MSVVLSGDIPADDLEMPEPSMPLDVGSLLTFTSIARTYDEVKADDGVREKPWKANACTST
jgi:hypothetical protein